VIDWSATAAWTALIVAIASPVLTSIINNRHQLKIKEIEMYQERRVKALENYLRSTSRLLATNLTDDLQGYGSARGEICLYISRELRDLVATMDELITNRDLSTAKAKLDPLIRAITEDYNDKSKNRWL
jgi:hypothetical protein